MQFSLSYLKEGKVLILVDLNCKNRVARCLSETTQTHLGIKEVHHRLLQMKKKASYGNLKQQSHQLIQTGLWSMLLTSVIPNGMLPT